MIDGLPQWRCHKVVGAFKITRIEAVPAAGEVRVSRYRLAGEYFSGHFVEVGLTFFRARSPDDARELKAPDDYIGGYLVQYEDGYLSWSPAAAFEAGYVRITPNLAAPDHGAHE